MDTELERALVESYPSLFAYYDADFDGPAPQISLFGFECGDGWYGVIESLCETIDSYDGELRVVQVKEKFGGLRFYYDGEGLSEQDAMRLQGAVRMASNVSYQVCELCGDEGEMRDNEGWYKTRCDSCFDG